jgi:rhodanese-related sulfurtransferase
VPLEEVTAADVSDDAFVLDVREPDEWAAGHVPGSYHVPMMQIPGRAGELPTDRDIVVACRMGARSAQVVAFLAQHGLEQVRNLHGGLYAWAAAGRPLVNGDGGAGQVI